VPKDADASCPPQRLVGSAEIAAQPANGFCSIPYQLTASARNSGGYGVAFLALGAKKQNGAKFTSIVQLHAAMHTRVGGKPELVFGVHEVDERGRQGWGKHADDPTVCDAPRNRQISPSCKLAHQRTMIQIAFTGIGRS
jgi:hypothetical protein